MNPDDARKYLIAALEYGVCLLLPRNLYGDPIEYGTEEEEDNDE